MAGKKSKKKTMKVAHSDNEMCCECGEKTKLEAGILLLIGFIWFLQTIGFFTFGGAYFQMIGAIMVIVMGMLKLLEKRCSC